MPSGLPKPWQRFRLKSWHGNVSLNIKNHPKGEFDAYAYSFQNAAHGLVERLRQQNGSYRDPDACPIVFLYRQAIELYLKAILVWGEGILRLQAQESFDFDKVVGTHKLAALMPLVKRVFDACGWVKPQGGEPKYGTYAEIETAILEIDEVDPLSYAFRYPINKKGKSALPDGFHFNVIAFGDEMDELLKMLDGAATGVYEHFQNLASIRQEYAGEL